MSVILKLRLSDANPTFDMVRSLPGIEGLDLDENYGLIPINPGLKIFVVRAAEVDDIERRKELSPEILETYGDIPISPTNAKRKKNKRTDPINVIIQVKYSPDAAAGSVVDTFPLSNISGLTLDEEFSPVLIPARSRNKNIDPRDVDNLFVYDVTPQSSSFCLRAEMVDRASLEELTKKAEANDEVIGVFADVKIQGTAYCPSYPHEAIGTDRDVETLLAVDELHNRGLDGVGVKVIVVDKGLNISYLNKRGKQPDFDATWSWTPGEGTVGEAPSTKKHGTMVAYDICIAAPKCTLVDHAILIKREATEPYLHRGLLSDAIASYGRILTEITKLDSGDEAGNIPSVVINNSWAMFHPSWDFPVDHPGNYSDNSAHPFNMQVETLNAANVDIVFAAGNCGAECPDRQCLNVRSRICGANSSRAVLCVAGVTIKKERLGYSSQGPGRLDPNKPDIACYTQFAGSNVNVSGADIGTSAAAPVAAGVIAAIRRAYPSSRVSPAVLRGLIRKTAEDRGGQGFDYNYGYGVLDVKKLLAALERYVDQ